MTHTFIFKPEFLVFPSIWVLFFVLCYQIKDCDSHHRRALKPLAECLRMPKTKQPPHARQVLNFILQNNLITSSSLPTMTAPRIVRRSVVLDTYCPFTFESESDTNRIPRTLAYASCRSKMCNNPVLCKPVEYSVMVLKRKCHGVWEWEQKKLPVAYVRISDS
ncbi:hypothetical protein QZH41_002833 [Actinostola sp. cb2023]|nr:hypothetical protein QZH41_002833 [Actinostola sp. cb2023]